MMSIFSNWDLNPATIKNSQLALEEREWKRSGDVLSDYLHLFESSSMYDCTFRVEASSKTLNTKPEVKVFKCHKLVLSVASKVFQIMFYGDFVEASKTPDDEIVIDDTLPAVFETAMRFVYGRKMDFKNEVIAAQVYKFANKWQIISLMDAADLYLEKVSPENVAFVYDIFKECGNKEGLERCMKVITENTREVLRSLRWCDASAELVTDVLSQQDLCIESECELLEGLFWWGEAQVKNRIEKPSDAEVREAINKPLQKIRFLTMEQQEFADFCLKSSSNILSVEEKFYIMMSITTGSMKNFPKNFSIEKKLRATVKSTAPEKLLWLNLQANKYTEINCDNNCLEFSANKRVIFVGFQLKSLSAYYSGNNYGYRKPYLESFEFTDALGVKIYEGSTKDFDEKLNFYRTGWKIVLEAGARYKIIVKHKRNIAKPKYISQHFKNLVINEGTLTVQLYGEYSGSGIDTLIFS
ncbi:uncharacterized protein LOC132198790 isoform X2 [Neocloeon triangulifer]|nr:uncharacterized protein LOC132198790 isoform X2 [Neocloeon triangulifer]